jgi:hypothetical protein
MNTNTPKTKKRLSAGAKILIASASIASTLGLWNIISGAAQNNNVSPEQDNPDIVKLPALPTLVPLRGAQVSSPAMVKSAGQNAGGQSLRSVAAPTATPPGIQKPVIQEVLIDIPQAGGGGGGGGGGSRKPSGSSKSSR